MSNAVFDTICFYPDGSGGATEGDHTGPSTWSVVVVLENSKTGQEKFSGLFGFLFVLCTIRRK